MTTFQSFFIPVNVNPIHFYKYSIYNTRQQQWLSYWRVENSAPAWRTLTVSSGIPAGHSKTGWQQSCVESHRVSKPCFNRPALEAHLVRLASLWVNQRIDTLKFTFHLFTFGCCMGLHWCTWAFSSCGQWGPLSGCGVWASHCGGFFCCRAWALGWEGFSSCSPWPQLPCGL